MEKRQVFIWLATNFNWLNAKQNFCVRFRDAEFELPCIFSNSFNKNFKRYHFRFTVFVRLFTKFLLFLFRDLCNKRLVLESHERRPHIYYYIFPYAYTHHMFGDWVIANLLIFPALFSLSLQTPTEPLLLLYAFIVFCQVLTYIGGQVTARLLNNTVFSLVLWLNFVKLSVLTQFLNSPNIFLWLLRTVVQQKKSTRLSLSRSTRFPVLQDFPFSRMF